MNTSLELSKQLKEAGFEKEGEFVWYNENINNGLKSVYKLERLRDIQHEQELDKDSFYAYDLLWDICVKYAKEVFGSGGWIISNGIYKKIRYGEPQKEIEDYIVANSILFK
jgi:hypothetical protein